MSSRVTDTANSNGSPAQERPRALICFAGALPSQRRWTPPAPAPPQSQMCLCCARQHKEAPPTLAKVCTPFPFLGVGKAHILSNTASGAALVPPQQMTPRTLQRCLALNLLRVRAPPILSLTVAAKPGLLGSRGCSTVSRRGGGGPARPRLPLRHTVRCAEGPGGGPALSSLLRDSKLLKVFK